MVRLQRNESVGSLAAGLWHQLDRTGQGAAKARVVSAWRSVAGDEVYAHARGFALRGDELLVFVDSPVWANELSVLAEHYRTAVNERSGKEMVGSIRFTVSRKVSEELKRDAEDAALSAAATPERTTPVAATEAEIEHVRQMAAAVENEGLREAVIAAAIRHLEWRKGTEALKAAEKAVQRATGPDSQPLR
jgi:hypothetical protein